MSCAQKPKTSRESSHASSIAPCLKYSPIEKFPSISKHVRCRSVEPTFSMSGVRKHFWQLVSLGAGGASRPRK